MTYRSRPHPSPIGTLTLVASDAGLAAILWEGQGWFRPEPLVEDRDHALLAEAARQLDDYFAGTRTAFDLPLDPVGTAFQRDVWRALAAIPHGETRSYGDVARTIGRPAAVRAVGAANGRNPIPIVLPCHRVIGANGTLTGFGGGLPVKRRLLALEGIATRD